MVKQLVICMAAGLILALYVSLIFTDTGYLLMGPGWSADGDGFDLYGMVNWLFLFSPVWGVLNWQNETTINMSHMTVYRYRYLSRWWISFVLEMILKIIAAYLIMGSVILILTDRSQIWQIGQAIFLIMLHAIALACISVWLRILSGSMIFSAVIILIFESMSKLLVTLEILPPVYSLFSWGMFNYSQQVYGKYGFNIIAVICLQLLLPLTLGLFIKGKFKDILLRRISDGENH